MDTETIERVEEMVEKLAEQHDIRLEKVIVFGSRVREDYREQSDVDLLIVSPDFEDVPWNERSVDLYLDWDYDTLPTPEFICLTPGEFMEKRERQSHIVRTAVKEGVAIA